MATHPPSYLKAIVIAHGKSEKNIGDYVKSNLKLKLEIVSDKKGAKSIQINSLLNFLNRTEFKSFRGFLTKYKYDLPINIKKLPDDFKVFIIMDTDDCSEEKKNAFISRTLFKSHWLKDYIVPIYNIENLETAMRKANIQIQYKKDYIKIFPVNQNGDVTNVKEIKNLSNKLKKHKDITNLPDFFDFCLDLLK